MVKKLTLEYFKELAISKKGKCLSNKYINNRTKLLWECEEGHQWETVPACIIRGTWCPKCSEGVSERICRKFFEIIFNDKFPKRKPEFLHLSKFSKLELDGYNEMLNLAFEYNGHQHYVDIKNWKSKVAKVRIRDDLKKELCKKNNVNLIIVPYYISYEKMKDYIVDECKRNGINIPPITKDIDYKLFDVYSPLKIKEMQELAKKNNGECLSKFYINNTTKLKWKCSCGYEWEAVPDSIRNGTWCPKCANNIRLTIEEMQDLAKKNNGECLSKFYINNTTKLKWKCKKGHTWRAVPDSIRNGTWCPKCANNVKLTVDEVKEIAKRRGFKWISGEYFNNKTKLKWECNKGHQWSASTSSINGGFGCPECAGLVKGTIEEMQELAKRHNGKCLSKTYINSLTKLEWECQKGHRWYAVPSSVKRGHWCRRCYGLKQRNTIENMQELAKSHNGECLSKEYVNNISKLKWRCKRSHEWLDTPTHIMQGRWCSICRKMDKK